ncbi:MAG: hypothetical protein K6T34_10705 [Thermoflavifilum sp.]|nr:hypothetical protein [Thermoflavifilum sp.]
MSWCIGWLSFLVWIMCAQFAWAQPYGNEWINYQKTYYKFKLAQEGIYRIPYAVLAAYQLDTVPAHAFQLWHLGRQVPLYISASGDTLHEGDYLEFIGFPADGLLDTLLFAHAQDQMSLHDNLFSDSSAYYLTVDDQSVNSRYQQMDNVIGSSPPPALPYCWYTAGYYPKTQINSGYAQVVSGEYIYASTFDAGEGFSSRYIYPSSSLNISFSNLQADASGPSATLYVRLAGAAPNNRNVSITLNQNMLIDTAVNAFQMHVWQINNITPTSLGNNAVVNIANKSVIGSDRIVVGSVELKYPHLFSFSQASYVHFQLSASDQPQYLVINQFNGSGTPPVLYDLRNQQRWIADTAMNGVFRFLLPATSVDRDLVLVNEGISTNIHNISSLQKRVFVNYALPGLQGNYLIITHPSILNSGDGVQQYAAYRSSVAGGGYRVEIISTDQLTDQFAYGIDFHPLSIRSFLHFAYDHFPIKPLYVFLIGKGITYDQYRLNQQYNAVQRIALVPTFGNPASDMLLSAWGQSIVPHIPIGRLSVINNDEVMQYLKKVKSYEANLPLNTSTASYSQSAWHKNVLHIIGADDQSLYNLLSSYFNGYEQLIRDTNYGANIITVSKFSTDPQVRSGEIVDTIFKKGISLINFFGHSSANTLGYNLDNPANLQNIGKYPVFIASGCSAGNIFVMDTLRLQNQLMLSESYVLAPDAGSIAFLANTYVGITDVLDDYNRRFYQDISHKMYGASLGSIMQDIVQTTTQSISNNFLSSCNLEQMALNGDPAIHMFSSSLPDYDVEANDIYTDPNIVSISQEYFDLHVYFYNLGKAIRDSMWVSIQRIYPSGADSVIYRRKIPTPFYSDSIILRININPLLDAGQNRFIVTLDEGNLIPEVSEQNNVAEKDLYIYSNQVHAIYPFDFSIVDTPSVHFYASTDDPMAPFANYVFQIDTTAEFNSPLLRQLQLNSKGGVLDYHPDISYIPGQVYYWRVATFIPNKQPIWDQHSFVYLPQAETGWNQSHYFQFLLDNYQAIQLLNNRMFSFLDTPKILRIQTGLYPYYVQDQIDVYLNQDRLEHYGCKYGSLQFMVFDSLSFQPWVNYNVGSGGRFGSYAICDQPKRYFFEFPYGERDYRIHAMQFIDSIPNGMWVSITNLGWTTNNSFIQDWMNDTTLLGSGQSLYSKLRALGLTGIDSFYRNIPFIFFFRKGDPSSVMQWIGSSVDEHLAAYIPVNIRARSGKIISPLIGPALSWKRLSWEAHDVYQQYRSAISLQVWGVDIHGNHTLFLSHAPMDTNIAFISATQYPRLQLVLQEADSIHGIAPQLDYWRVYYNEVPEGAIAPNVFFQASDSIIRGQPIHLAVAFQNVSRTSFIDSMKIKLTIADEKNITHQIPMPRWRKLLPGDTLLIQTQVDSKDFPGNNVLNLLVNPDHDQPEAYSFNNVLYHPFYVRPSDFNPLLDVTFDGIHILNNDIVSAKPHILIRLQDVNPYLQLQDTSLFQVQVRYPDGSLHNYYFDQDTLRLLNENNYQQAQVLFTPSFMQDGSYELIVQAKNPIDLSSGPSPYRVSFQVINKPMISHLLNYPNPFTTSTAFVFTITGSEVPSQLKIEILTITGHIVRIINKDELGPLHIGRNITTFRWDGTDQYGNRLGNGVYLYRVVASLHGQPMDIFHTGADQFITNGYGKMYLMR